MSFHGKNLIAGVPAQSGGTSFKPVSPLNGHPLEPAFSPASLADVNAALISADAAFSSFSRTTAEARAVFLETVASNIVDLGDDLLQRAHHETGLPLDRLTGERGRTVNQLRMFAEVIREGSWRDARIDSALPDRAPLPRPDLRRILVPLGPVIVFGASNFPLAFSVAGGDTASALAAGCPVVVKAHPAHPGTSELVAGAISRALETCGLPAGTFSLLHDNGIEVGLALVNHPLSCGVGFTGSHRGGRALFDAAARRPNPIPVFAEMSSLNPIFLLPGALRERGVQLAGGLKNSITGGVGQFCTKPGLIFAIAGEELTTLSGLLEKAIQAVPPAPMLHAGICTSYHSGLKHLAGIEGVVPLAHSEQPEDAAQTQAGASLFSTKSSVFLKEKSLHEEVFGPCSLLVEASDTADLLELARSLDGQLTATVHGTDEDFQQAGPLLEILQRKAGRLLLNGFPTGVEVCASMHHGGPYPATTDTRFTSVGTAAIQRWARPVCFQNFPPEALPEELQNANPRGLLRQINGQLTKAAAV
jgi:NADP-dependent aldehyde dehydrogenase